MPLADETRALLLCLLRLARVTTLLPAAERSEQCAARAAIFLAAFGNDAGTKIDDAKVRRHQIQSGAYFEQGLAVFRFCLSFSVACAGVFLCVFFFVFFFVLFFFGLFPGCYSDWALAHPRTATGTNDCGPLAIATVLNVVASARQRTGMLQFWPGIRSDYNTALPQLSDALRGAVLSAVCVGGVRACAF